MNAFDETYLLDIKEDYIEHNNVTIPYMFKNLCKNYRRITDSDLLANKEAMNKAWDPDAPVQIVYKQVEEGTKFAKLADVIIQDKEKIAIDYNLIH